MNKRGKAVEVLVGGVIESRRISALREDDAAIQYLRLRTDWLARRTAAPPASASPVRQEPVAAMAGREAARCELMGLTPLLETRDFAVYLSAAEKIPVLLNEIGRAREIAFRAVGEGTGLARDLDRFDPHYLHLFVWNRERYEIAGAYRIGEVLKLLSRFGRAGLYTNSLFKMDDAFLRNLGPSLELGRSFIAPAYQRQFSPLLLLWQGIGKFIAAHPEYATLIGAVSVSNQYSAASRELIVRYFDKCTKSDLGTVSARRALPATGRRGSEMQALCSLLSDIDDLSAPIEDMEPDGKGLPVLVCQYARLGGKLLAFTVDPAFGNTLDGFVMVDLRSTGRELLSRYLGREGSAKFLAWHGGENIAKPSAFPA